MDPVQPTITIKCSDKEVICSARLGDFSEVFRNAYENEPTAPIIVTASSSIMNKIIDFYKAYNFDPKEFKSEEFTKSIKSDKLNETIGVKNVQLLQEYVINESEVNYEAMKEIVEVAYAYNFVDIKEILLKAIGTQFYCGTIEPEIEAYKKKFNIPEDIPPEEQLKIMSEDYKDAFERLNQKLRDELTLAEKGE